MIRIASLSMSAALVVVAAHAQTPDFHASDPAVCAALYIQTGALQFGMRRMQPDAILFGGNEAKIDFYDRAARLESRHGIERLDTGDLAHRMFRFRLEGMAPEGAADIITRAQHARMLAECDGAHRMKPVLHPGG